MSFKINDKGKFTPDQRLNIHERINDFHRENDELRKAGARPKTATSLYNELKAESLGYRKQDVLDDIRRSGVSFRAKTVEASETAQSFYDNVLEPIRKEYKTTQKEAFKIWHRLVEEDYQNLVEAEYFNQIWDIYKGLA